jgi:formate hydrogenlyase subunit 3/multisubunit Na+/H+ antiporter MnhD subunit
MSMTASRIETWVWVFVYAGMLVLGVGLAVARTDGALGWVIAAVGIFSIAVGALLVWVRSRMKSPG